MGRWSLLCDCNTSLQWSCCTDAVYRSLTHGWMSSIENCTILHFHQTWVLVILKVFDYWKIPVKCPASHGGKNSFLSFCSISVLHSTSFNFSVLLSTFRLKFNILFFRGISFRSKRPAVRLPSILIYGHRQKTSVWQYNEEWSACS